MTTFRLASVAPRLALARDQYVAEIEARRIRERSLRNRRHELQKLIAHRELQLARAQALGKGRYIDIRQRKLDDARQRLARLEEAA